MRLLFLTEFYPQNKRLVYTGGVEVRTYHVAERAKKDFAVKIISSNSSHVPATPGSILSRLMYLLTSFWQAFNTPFDLIEGSNFVTYWPAFLAAKIKGKPVVAWIPDVLGRRWFDFGFLVGLFGCLAEIIALKLKSNQRLPKTSGIQATTGL